LNREFFGDGSMRQVAPVSPALHLGADRVVVVGTAKIRNETPERIRGDLYPTLAQVAGHVMNSIFLDSLAVDLERLERINRTVSCSAPEALKKMGLTLHHVDVLVLTPSEPLEAIAVRHVRSLPFSIRFLLRSVGAMRRGGANLASYLLFEQGYCRELIQLGYHDTLKRREEVEAFLAGGLSIVPGASRAREVPGVAARARPLIAARNGDAPARRLADLSAPPAHHHPLDGQRRVRAREQRVTSSYFDTVVNTYLIARGALDIQASPVIGLVVETRLPVPRAAHLSRDRDRGRARRARRALERALRDRALRGGIASRRGAGPFRARVRRSRFAPPGGAARGVASRARTAANAASFQENTA
jgi:hypothetical protein